MERSSASATLRLVVTILDGDWINVGCVSPKALFDAAPSAAG
jgi:hypothetical protein